MRALIAILFLVSCSQDSMMLAKVNGDPITFGHFKVRLREIEFDQTLVAPNDLLSLKKYILNEMIEEKIIQQQAEAMNVKMTPEDITSAIEKNFSSILMFSVFPKRLGRVINVTASSDSHHSLINSVLSI